MYLKHSVLLYFNAVLGLCVLLCVCFYVLYIALYVYDVAALWHNKL